MPLNAFTRTNAYFQNIRDQGKISGETMDAESFDSQFSEFGNYLNNTIRPAVNGLIAGAVPGVIGQANTFLRNIGDGATEFAAINNDAILDGTLSWQKLQPTNPGSILSTSAGQNWVNIAPTAGNQVLISTDNDVPVWRKITAVNIEDRNITGTKIALQAIAAEHLQPGVMINNLPNARITGNNFADQALANTKFTRNTIEIRNLGIVSLAGLNPTRFNGLIRREHIAPGTISPAKIQNGQVGSPQFNKVKCIGKNKLMPQNITENHLIFDAPTSGIFGHIPTDILSPNFGLTATQIEDDYLEKRYFDPLVEAAFTLKGC